MSQRAAKARCRCGTVTLELSAQPIEKTSCHCSSCIEAGEVLEKLPNGEAILDESGGVSYVLFRKDAIRCTAGREYLREHRLTAGSLTRRVVAVCCSTFMFLDFTKGHWVSVHRDRIEDAGVIAHATFQNRQSPMFLLRLLAAWAGMGFRNPKIDFVDGQLNDVGI